MEILLDFDEIELVTRDLRLQPLFPRTVFEPFSLRVIEPENWEMYSPRGFTSTLRHISRRPWQSHHLMGRGVSLSPHLKMMIGSGFEVEHLDEQVRSGLPLLLFPRLRDSRWGVCLFNALARGAISGNRVFLEASEAPKVN